MSYAQIKTKINEHDEQIKFARKMDKKGLWKEARFMCWIKHSDNE